MKLPAYCLIVLSVISTRPAVAYGRIDSLLEVLDVTLEQREIFESELKHTIAEVKAGMRPSLSDRDRYRINKRLVELYRPYIYDSAMYYVAQNRTLARSVGDRQLINENSIDYSNMLLSGGMYHEAIENIKAIPRGELSDELLIDYWLTCDQTYHHMSLYTAGSSFQQEYQRISNAYVDSLGGMIHADSKRYFALSRIYLKNPDKRIARALLENLLDELRPGSHDYAIVSATLADTYDEQQEDEMEKKLELLAVSAISDISSNIKEYVSLSSLGGLLYLKGDVERAYRYGVISMEDANFYNARLRRIEMSRIFPIVEHAYKQELDLKNLRLRNWGLMLGFLAVLMLGLIIYVTRQTFTLRRIRKKLIDTNDRLVEIGHVKDEYLGRFLKMSSSYVNRLERYQQTINLKLTAGKVEDVRVMVRSSDVINREIQEFYRSFDKAFLHLYPNFTADLNSLLLEGEQIRSREGELLSTEVRIYALVRLGISNPADIAKFLRYSANTVYTYRHKVRSKAKNKDTFEKDILNIGF